MPDQVFAELSTKAITADDIYPYRGVKGSCKLSFGEESYIIMSQKNFSNVMGTEDDLKFNVAKYGPTVAGKH